MSGLAPLSGSPATALPGSAPAVPSSGTSGAQQTPPPKKNDGPHFTAFPSSYDGFGANGKAFGTLSVVNGRLSVTSAPAQPPASEATGAPPQTQSAAETAPKPPPPPPPPPPKALAAPDGAETLAPHQPDNSPIPGSNPAPEPAGSLAGGNGPAPIPGATPAESDPKLALLGAPATNPIVVQAEQQQAAAAEEAIAEADAAAVAKAVAQTKLQQVDFRIAAARADNNAAAVAQLQPAATRLTGQIQGQEFAGLGQTPPQPFARPEIPTVFLNVAS